MCCFSPNIANLSGGPREARTRRSGERYIMKSRDLLSLLGQIKTCVSCHSLNMRIMQHYRFIAQMQKLSKQMEKKKSPEKIKAHVN